MAKATRKKNAKLKIPEIQAVKIADLKPHPNNPRVHPDSAIAALVNSIQSFGWTVPIVITKDNIILAGHARLKAAREAGYSEIPAITVPLKGAQADAYMVADNRLAELTDWDLPVLKQVLGELDKAEIDLELMGFGQEEIEELLGLPTTEIVEDEVPPIPEKAVCRLGDLWLLGDHRLLCGDATEKADVERLMDGRKADMVFTDPPYGVNIKGGKNKGALIAGDLTQTAIPFSFELAVLLATNSMARFYFCGGEGNIGLYHKLFDRYLGQLPKILIWVKNGFVMKQNGYHNQYELLFYGYKKGGGGKKYWFGGRSGAEASDVWQIKRDPPSTYQHPTQKPVEIAARAILNHSQRRGLIYDPFLGSGSTIIATEELERVLYGMDLDPHYCDVIIQRWQNFTGREAVNEKGEAWSG